MDAELRAAADRLAQADGLSFSAFVSNAVSDAVGRRTASAELLAAVTDWEVEHGAITDAELTKAASELGLTLSRKGKTSRPGNGGNTPARVMGVKVGSSPTSAKRFGRVAATAKKQSAKPKSKAKKSTRSA